MNTSGVFIDIRAKNKTGSLINVNFKLLIQCAFSCTDGANLSIEKGSKFKIVYKKGQNFKLVVNLKC